jgi:hypothetical protein
VVKPRPYGTRGFDRDHVGLKAHAMAHRRKR